MTTSLRFLVAESETEDAREARRRREGRSNGESYLATLRELAPDAGFDLVRPAEAGAELPDGLGAYAGVFLTGSPLHVYQDSPEVRRVLEFMRAVFGSGVPSFGSCAGLQVAAAAAGGSVRRNRRGHELPIARRITLTAAGAQHVMLRGRSAGYDALTLHSDEVEALPPGATLLSTNEFTSVQAAEIRFGGGVFWGVQYHPELPPKEIGGALRAHAEAVVAQGLAQDEAVVADLASKVEALGADPVPADVRWLLGVSEQLTDPTFRTLELQNFVQFAMGRCQSPA